jgi:hypothetical protein
MSASVKALLALCKTDALTAAALEDFVMANEVDLKERPVTKVQAKLLVGVVAHFCKDAQLSRLLPTLLVALSTVSKHCTSFKFLLKEGLATCAAEVSRAACRDAAQRLPPNGLQLALRLSRRRCSLWPAMRAPPQTKAQAGHCNFCTGFEKRCDDAMQRGGVRLRSAQSAAVLCCCRRSSRGRLLTRLCSRRGWKSLKAQVWTAQLCAGRRARAHTLVAVCVCAALWRRRLRRPAGRSHAHILEHQRPPRDGQYHTRLAVV